MTSANMQVITGGETLTQTGATKGIGVTANTSKRKPEDLWRSGLGGSLLFSVGETEDPEADREAQNIVQRYSERQRHLSSPMEMSEMVDMQRLLQLRSQVVSAVATLMENR